MQQVMYRKFHEVWNAVFEIYEWTDRHSRHAHCNTLHPPRGKKNGGDLGWPRSSAMSPFDTARMTSSSPLSETMQLTCTVFDIFVESCKFFLIHVYLVPPIEFQQDLWNHKTRIPRLSCDIICMMIHLGRWTDKWTDTRPQHVLR